METVLGYWSDVLVGVCYIFLYDLVGYLLRRDIRSFPLTSVLAILIVTPLFELSLLQILFCSSWMILQSLLNRSGLRLWKLPLLISSSEFERRGESGGKVNLAEHFDFIDQMFDTYVTEHGYRGLKGVYGYVVSILLLLTRNPMKFGEWLRSHYLRYEEDESPISFEYVWNQALYIRSPQDLAELYKREDEFRFIPEPNGRRRFREVLPRNPVTSKDREWHQMRVRTFAYLKGAALEEYVQIMRKTLETHTLPLWREYAERGEYTDISRSIFLMSSIVSFESLGIPSEEVRRCTEIHDMLSYYFEYVRIRTLSKAPFLDPVFDYFNKVHKKNRNTLRNFFRRHLHHLYHNTSMGGSIVRGRVVRKDIEEPSAFDAYAIAEKLSKYYAIPDLGEFVEDIRSTYSELHSKAEGYIDHFKVLDEKTRANLVEPYTDTFQLAERLRSRAARFDKLKDSPPEHIINAELGIILCRGGVLKEEHALDELIAMALGASETTYIHIGWTMLELSKHPEIQDRVYEELKTLGGYPIPNVSLETKTINNLLKEGLRLHPPAYFLISYVGNGAQLSSGHYIPPNTSIWFSQYELHRRKDLWGEDAETYNPDRWNRETPEAGTYLPFSSGKRRCPGEGFAKSESLYTLATILRHFKFTCKDSVPHYDPGMTLRSDTPIEFKLIARE